MNNTNGIIGQFSRITEAANLIIKNELSARKIEGIVPAHGPILVFLFEQSGPIPIKTIVQKIRRVKSTVTAMINNLERNGYISKQPCQRDTRIINVELTAKGNNIRKDFFEISEILINKTYNNIPENQQQDLMKQLSVIESNLT
ncbi:MAG: winged helix-turn-helix transcriptional regulator [Phycisphaerae bacterium]|nr:winged helix-turn-helix transcriptional regulator [Phycisphaerae bacterium]